MKNKQIEVEGGELLIMSDEGHYAVIPAKHRQEVMDMIKDGCTDCVNNYIQTLPKESDYAEDGSLLPDWDKVTDPPTKVESTDPPPGKFADPLDNSLSNWDKVKTAINPKNWGVTDYTDKGDFNTAYTAARKVGEKEFMWNNQRFNTKSDMSPEQQMKAYGITDKQRLKSNVVRDRIEDNIYDFEYHSRNPISKMTDVVLRNKKEEDYLDDKGEIQESDKTHKDLLSLYLGKPQKYNTVNVSKYKPSASKEKDKEYFSINSKYFEDHILNHLYEDFIPHGIKHGRIKPARNKNDEVIPNRYVTTDVGTGLGEFTIDRGKDEHGNYLSYWDEWDLNPYKGRYSAMNVSDTKDLSFGVGKPFDVYGRIYYRENPKYDTYQKIEKEIDEARDKYFKTQDSELRKKLNEKLDVLIKERSVLDKVNTRYARYIRQYYSDKELSELDIDKKNFDALALQKELSNRGYKLPKSTKEDGTFDGLWGDETKNALLDYQKKNQPIKNPLSDNQKKDNPRRYPLLDNQPIKNPLTGMPIKNKTK